MPLSAGSKFGSYEVLSLLGSGGMGEVYRARDTQLGRSVAIKILPDAFATDSDRIARFVREAQTLAALNHPSIAQIYGVVEQDPSSATTSRALVMELVDGETLADRIARGPIPFDEVLPIARQIADALAAAHVAGIIHRDLKPANIKIRPDGVVKVLDFGLAKFDPSTSTGSVVSAPTITSPALTATGVILGTAAYMSPEQAKGRLADKRSDIWAFGCVLFEMMTSQRAFRGDDVAETLAAVLKSDPDWSTLPADTPPLVRRLVQRCLEKNVSARVPDIAVALFELSEPATAWSTTDAIKAPRTRRTQWLIAAASLTAALASGVAVWLWVRSDTATTSPTRVTRLALVPPSGVQFADVAYPLAITPHSRRIVFIGEKNGVRQFYVRSLDSADAQLIPGTDGIDPRVTLSPDGRSLLAFDRRNRMLKKVPIDGGTAESICQLPADAARGIVRGESWGRGGNIVFAMEPEAGLMIVRETGGLAQPLTTASEGEVHGRPQFLPDGKQVLFAGRGGLSVVNVDTREVRSVMPTPFAQYLSSGHLSFLQGGTLWVTKFDVNSLQPVGDASPLADAISLLSNAGPARMSVSDDGTLAYVVGTGAPVTTRESSLMLVDAQGRESPIPNIPPGRYGFVRISPTGDKIAVSSIPGAAARVAVYDMRRGVMTPITSDTRGTRPLWADRDTLLFERMRDRSAALYSQRADGTGEATPVWTPSAGGWTYTPTALLPDGRLIVSKARTGSYGIYREQDLVLVTPGNEAATPLLSSTDNEAHGVLSPNGEWIAYESDRTGRYEVWVERFPAMTERQPISTDGGASPVWSIDGRRLFYMSNDGRQVLEVQVSLQPGGLIVSKPRLRVQGDYFPPQWGYRRFDVMPDGNQFVLLKPAADDRGTPLEVIVVEGWFDELRRRLP